MLDAQVIAIQYEEIAAFGHQRTHGAGIVDRLGFDNFRWQAGEACDRGATSGKAQKSAGPAPINERFGQRQAPYEVPGADAPARVSAAKNRQFRHARRPISRQERLLKIHHVKSSSPVVRFHEKPQSRIERPGKLSR